MSRHEHTDPRPIMILLLGLMAQHFPQWMPQATAESVPVIHFDPAEGLPDGGSLVFDKRGFAAPVTYMDEGTYGWGFDLSSPATLTHLGVLDEGADGLSTTFEVGLWRQQELTAYALVPEGDAAPLNGLWRIAPVEPQLLQPGHYIIGAAPMSPTDDPVFSWSFYDGDRETDLDAVTVDDRVDVSVSLLYRSTEGQGFHRPQFGLLVNGAYVGPNAFFVAVPEPATWIVLTVGSIPLAVILGPTGTWLLQQRPRSSILRTR